MLTGLLLDKYQEIPQFLAFIDMLCVDCYCRFDPSNSHAYGYIYSSQLIF